MPVLVYDIFFFSLNYSIFFLNSGIYADGPGAYLFHGVVEQQYIFHVMDHAMCLSESKQGSCDKHVARGGKRLTTSSKSLLGLEKQLLAVTIALMFLLI